MDFIKTSSLRALIELTFQRNWNGLIWMSRKGVIAKRVKTAPDGSIENQRPNADGWPRNECSALGQNHPSCLGQSSTVRPITSRPGKHVPRSAKSQPRRARPCRASREQASRPRNLLAYHGRCIRPSREERPTSGRNHRPIFTRPTQIIRPRPFRRPDPTVRPTVPTDRPNAAVDPKPFLKPNPHNSSPKPAPT
ncbi:unnamed protein product [Microthlaspi erraticum]|uniref:Uncharacterized protein n=1 Tax=Microthlaspi erraticum TaxID=1685480 RepID=A0A6D2KLY3_9BRAS|nr:unnamed protein product [Microthlaspi erraticum]